MEWKSFFIAKIINITSCEIINVKRFIVRAALYKQKSKQTIHYFNVYLNIWGIYIFAYTHPFIHIGKDILENLVSENIHKFYVGFLQIWAVSLHPAFSTVRREPTLKHWMFSKSYLKFFVCYRDFWFIMGGSWWRGQTEHGPLEKGRANHFSILALRTSWTVGKGKMIGQQKRNSPGH